ncbi:RNA polymerase subunit sigma, partial [Acinetobacter baumannii]|nr:RNA polymerase subunit sigma [Acinetobacter baumannii]MCJ9203411.1 RNA polymerase subunit sigma [Acinetobacter baumannii]MDT1832266.1 RNA polymerase subunit sigma [Acinetobacter baumannii]
MIIIIICEFLVLSPIAVNKTSLLVDQLYRSHQS